jgi:predicted DNA binding protein
MTIITEVQFVHELGALADTLNDLPQVSVSVVRDARTDPDHTVYVLRFEGESLATIESVRADDRTVESVRTMDGFEDQRLLGIEFAAETELLNPEVTSLDGFVLEARGATVYEGRRGWQERWLLPDGQTLRSIWQYARENGFEFEVLQFSQHGQSSTDFRTDDVVTTQQREALTMAFEGGYFTEPREMSLEELADELDLSSTAAAGRLRRGMKSLVGSTVIVGDPER